MTTTIPTTADNRGVGSTVMDRECLLLTARTAD